MANAAYIQGKIFYGYGQAAKRLGRNYKIYRATTAINPITNNSYYVRDILAGIDENYKYDKPVKFGDRTFQLLADANAIIDSFTITNPGSGYILPPAVQFVGGNGSGAQAKVTITGGQISAITLTNPGIGYTVAPTINLIGGIYDVAATATCSISPGLKPFDYLVLNDPTFPNYFDQSIFYVTNIFPLVPMSAQLCNRIITIRRANGTTKGFNPNYYSGFDKNNTTILYQNCPASMLENSRGEMPPTKLPIDVKQPYFRVFLPYLGGVDIRIGDFLEDQENEGFFITSAELTDQGWRLIAMTAGT